MIATCLTHSNYSSFKLSLKFYEKTAYFQIINEHIRTNFGCRLNYLICHPSNTTIHLQASDTIYFSVKTTPKYYKSRLSVLKTTWFQEVKRDKVG